MADKPKILTVDDDPDILDVLDLTLSEFYEVKQAGNGKEGIETLKTFTPDLIICDYMMPIMNGREFCISIKLRNVSVFNRVKNKQVWNVCVYPD